MIRKAKRLRRRAPVILAVTVSAVAVVLAAAGIVLAPFDEGSIDAISTPTPTQTPTPTPTNPPQATSPPRVASVRGTIAGWMLPDRSTIASVLPAVGSAATGAVSVLINAPVIESRADVVSTSAAVQPSTAYKVGLTVRQIAKTPIRPSAQVVVGARRFSLPKITDSWQRIEFEYTTTAEEASVAVSLALYGAVLALEVDDFTLETEDGANVLPNASFEDARAEPGVANDSLVLSRQHATIGLSLPPGEASWSVTAADGRVITQGVAAIRGPLTAVPLAGVEQGYFTFSVSDASGRVIETPIAVVDMESHSLSPDPRFGVGLHLERSWYEDAGSLAASSVSEKLAMMCCGISMRRSGESTRSTRATPTASRNCGQAASALSRSSTTTTSSTIREPRSIRLRVSKPSETMPRRSRATSTWSESKSSTSTTTARKAPHRAARVPTATCRCSNRSSAA